MKSRTIPALVLSCDRYRCLSRHMTHQYDRLWPGHPFLFHLPWQDEAPDGFPPSSVFLRCPVGIQETVAALLEGFSPDDWVYWCIDDKYPMTLDIPKLRALTMWLETPGASNVDGLLFCRCRKMLDPAHLAGPGPRLPRGMRCLERRDYSQIWIHQFLRVKVLRHLFEGFPREIRKAGEMDRHKDRMVKPAGHRLFVTSNSYATFGESTAEGILTANCRQSLTEQNLPLPVWAGDEVAPAFLMTGPAPAGFSRTRQRLLSIFKRFYLWNP